MGALSLLKKRLSSPTRNATQGNVQWVEGVRGLAALCVVCHHLMMALRPDLEAGVRPEAAGGGIAFLQMPMIRTLCTGATWVTIFYILTGYTNAIKPIKMSRDGNIDGAASALASSAFRKMFRIVLPTMCAGVALWFAAQLDCYALTHRVTAESGGWLKDTTQPASSSWPAAFKDLFKATYRLWAHGDFIYDRNFWALPRLLRGSFSVFTLVLVTVRCQPRFRMLLAGGIYLYYWLSDGSGIMMNFLIGVVIAELGMQFPPGSSSSWSSSRTYIRIIPILSALTAWLLMGTPPRNVAQAPWSNRLLALGQLLFPSGAEAPTYWFSVGCQLFMVSITFSPELQSIFSTAPMIWLGKISFAMYLVHGFVIRTFLVWFLYGLRNPVLLYAPNPSGGAGGGAQEAWEAIPAPYGWMYPLGIVFTFVVIIMLACLFNTHVEPWCARVTKRIEEVACPAQVPRVVEITGLEKIAILPRPNGLD